jgi:hypothetical protein
MSHWSPPKSEDTSSYACGRWSLCDNGLGKSHSVTLGDARCVCPKDRGLVVYNIGLIHYRIRNHAAALDAFKVLS